MDVETIAIMFIAIAVGAFAKGLTGIGLPIITIPILSGFLGVEHAVVVMTLPVFVSNLWIVWSYRKLAHNVPKLASALIFAAIGTLLGTFVLASLNDHALKWLMIVWIGLYLLTLLFKPDFQLVGRAAERVSPLLATFAGISQGATGISGPVVATWIHSYRLEKEIYVFAVSIMFLVISGTHVTAIAGGGMMSAERLLQALIAVVPIMLFVPAGMRMTRYLSPRVFNWMIIACIFAMELRLIWKQLV